MGRGGALFILLTGYLTCFQKRLGSQVALEFTLTMDDVIPFGIRLYRKCSGRLYRSTGCGSPRWISDNDYYQRLFWRKFEIPNIESISKPQWFYFVGRISETLFFRYMNYGTLSPSIASGIRQPIRGKCKSQIVSHNEAKTSEKAEFTWK